MQLFITGSNSFVGKELIKQCNEKQISYVGVDTVIDPGKQNEYVFDIRNQDISDVMPEGAVIVHLAALSRDPDCKNNAYQCFDVNVMGTLNLMRAAIKKNAKQFIFASSEWVYDQFIGNEVKDETALINIHNHTSEYALSKLVSEVNLKQQFNNGFCDTTILRFGIIYGPRSNNWAAVESIFSNVKNKAELTIGSLKTGRRFIHVIDICRGILQSVALPGFHTINLTGNDLITLKDLVETGEKILNKSVTVIESNPANISLRNPANDAAKKMIGWEPSIDLSTGLKSLLEFV